MLILSLFGKIQNFTFVDVSKIFTLHQLIAKSTINQRDITFSRNVYFLLVVFTLCVKVVSFGSGFLNGTLNLVI